jgi:phosphate-selective porin
VDKISSPIVAEEFDEEIASVYAVFTRETPEVLAEYVHTNRVGETTGDRYTADGYYIQVAYRLPFFKSRLKPYGRWEAMDVDSNDPIFAVTTDLQKYLLGARADVSNYVALKLEYVRKRTDPGTGFNEVFLQAAITF